MGASSETNLGTTGGASSYKFTIDQLPSHSHSGSTSSNGNHSHSGSTNTTGNHFHHTDIIRRGPEGGPPSNIHITPAQTQYDPDIRWTTTTAGDHSHSINTNSAGSHTHSFTTNVTGSGASIDNRPAYYALAFIMKL